MKKLKNILIISAVAFAVSACGNLSDVSKDGKTDNPVFPKVESSTFNSNGSQHGSWVNWDNVRQLEAGMNKDQIYNLIGRPHFNEGLFGVREWDYVFNYRENGEHKTCQFKILFDKNMEAQQFLWFPNGCNSAHELNISTDFLFAFNQATLTSQGKVLVNELADKMKQFDVKEAIIEGHTDRIGSDSYNLALSQRRADAVKAELTQLGVEANLTATGLGETQPIKDCVGNDEKAKDCLAPNRRVTVKINASNVPQEAEKQAGEIGPAPLYDTNYPYSPRITGK